MKIDDMWLWFSVSFYKKHSLGERLLKKFNTAEKVYLAGRRELEDTACLTNKDIDYVLNSRESFNSEEIKKKMAFSGTKFSHRDSGNFPGRLRLYSDCPFGIFYIGNLPNDSAGSVAVVGARACSSYGARNAKKIAEELSNGEVNVISGMARGIDTFALEGAMRGKTGAYAVLGCGADICYPGENIETYTDILKKGGGIISEYPPGTPPLSWHFPMRNRLISGLADVLIVIEAREKSGTLITVEWALEQGKDIYALPGRVEDPLSVGTNRLIRNGAGILTSVDDILEEFNIKKNTKTPADQDCFSSDEKKILRCISDEQKDADTIIEETGMSLGSFAEAAAELIFSGKIIEIEKNIYTLN